MRGNFVQRVDLDTERSRLGEICRIMMALHLKRPITGDEAKEMVKLITRIDFAEDLAERRGEGLISIWNYEMITPYHLIPFKSLLGSSYLLLRNGRCLLIKTIFLDKGTLPFREINMRGQIIFSVESMFKE